MAKLTTYSHFTYAESLQQQKVKIFMPELLYEQLLSTVVNFISQILIENTGKSVWLVKH